jgi:hypothetical protein
MKKSKILICGDSYMARDHRMHLEHASMHWSHHLGDEFEVFNHSWPGASNAIIAWRLTLGIKEINPDFIIIGFTNFYRVEFSLTDTRCHPYVISDPDKKKFYEDSIRYSPPELEMFKNYTMAAWAIELAKKQAPTAYLLNNFKNALGFCPDFAVYKNSIFRDLEINEFPFCLMGHEEWGPQEGCVFHVKDPAVHQSLAQMLRTEFLLKNN